MGEFQFASIQQEYSNFQPENDRSKWLVTSKFIILDWFGQILLTQVWSMVVGVESELPVENLVGVVTYRKKM